MALAFLDFLLSWDIGTLILAAAVLTLVVLAGSYGMALAWRNWKDGRRAKAARAKGLPLPRELPTSASRLGLRFQPRAIATKIPKLGRKAQEAPSAAAPAPEAAPAKRALPKVTLPKFGRKKPE